MTDAVYGAEDDLGKVVDGAEDGLGGAVLKKPKSMPKKKCAIAAIARHSSSSPPATYSAFI